MLKELSFVRYDKQNREIYLYQCGCGNTKEIPKTNVVRDLTKSCGCLKFKKRPRKYKSFSNSGFEDITGQKWNKLTAVKFIEYSKYGSIWKFKCECGEFKIARASNVKKGTPKCCKNCRKKPKIKQEPKHAGKLITFNNKTLNIREWAEQLTIKYQTLQHRLRSGLTLEQIFKGENLPKKGKKFKDIINIRYGELIAIKYLKGGVWLWQCDCGEQIQNTEKGIIDKKDQSCGHFKRKCKQLSCRWKSIRKRCLDKNNQNYHNYGGRGIKICEEWLDDCTKFYKWSFENGFEPNLQCDRIDNDGPYSPENCRWVTRKQNCRNKRSNRKVTYNGKTQTVVELSEELNINYSILSSRLRIGHKLEDILGDGVIKIKGLDNQQYDLLLSTKQSDNPSSLHLRTRNLIQNLFPNIKVYEEISLPGSSIKNSRLRCDFLIPSKNLIIEVNGEQHYSDRGYFGSKESLEYRQFKDTNKERWAYLNAYKLLVLSYNETEEQWINKLKSVL